MRSVVLERKTNETNIRIELNIDGAGKSQIDTGIGFFDHMLTLFSFFSGFDLNVKCEGDLLIDSHHTVEDIGLLLGQALKEVWGDKKGINRYAHTYIPMDEALSRTVIDLSNRPTLVYNVMFNREKLGDMDTQNFKEFFKSLVNEAKMTLHIEVLYGENDHHKIESVFKGIGKSLKDATRIIGGQLPSTKGVL